MIYSLCEFLGANVGSFVLNPRVWHGPLSLIDNSQPLVLSVSGRHVDSHQCRQYCMYTLTAPNGS